MKRQFTKIAPCIKSTFVFLCFFAAFRSSAQTTTFRVFFKDKGPVPFVKGNALYDETLGQFNERALERRRKVLPEDSLITLTDAPVYAPYVDSLQKRGAKILLKLRWKNYAVVEVDSLLGLSFKNLTFVENVQPTREKMTTLSFKNVQDNFLIHSEYTSPVFADGCGQFGYGRSFNQAQIMNVPPLHAMGFTGTGTLTGFLDNGFRWKSHNALKNISVVAEYDFIYQDSVTENEPEDIGSQDNHGTPVLSTVAGFLNDSLIGIAPKADFILAKTEDMRYERRIEEDNYAAGIEWMESRGADVASSSLGYYEFTEEGTSYSYDELSGNRSITAQAVNRAVALSMVCVTAAGNEGPGIQTLATPGDADSVITCAAVLPNGQAAVFSSRGPRTDGFLKPDIAAQGATVRVTATGTQNTFVNTNGTSFATPLTAGNITLLLSAFPELRPWEVRTILYSSGSQANAKDNVLGYGIPDMVKAFKNAGIAISPIAQMPKNNFHQVFVHILTDEFLTRSELNVRFKDETGFQKFELLPTRTNYLYIAEIPIELFKNSYAEAYVMAETAVQSRRMPFKKDEFTILANAKKEVPCGVNPALLNNPEQLVPFPSIVTEGTGSVNLLVKLENDERVEIRVFNVIGQEMFSTDSFKKLRGTAEVQIPTGNFPQGAYFVHIKHGDKSDFTKFVVAR
jgi:hypothetical protein